MSVLEPAVQQAAPPSVPAEQHEETGAVYVPPTAPEQTVLDHVRSHSMKCYWDFVECRWQCGGR